MMIITIITIIIIITTTAKAGRSISLANENFTLNSSLQEGTWGSAKSANLTEKIYIESMTWSVLRTIVAAKNKKTKKKWSQK